MKKQIFEYLQTFEKPTKRSVVLAHLRTLGFDCSDREMRATIEEMIVRDGYLIRSSELGYSAIRTRSEMEAAMKYLNAKAEAIAIRKNCLSRNWKEKHKEEFQPTLFQ